MIDVDISNFQAIDRLQLTIDGFTALVGRSNIGKSSIVRALKCALTGSSSSDDVRHDIETCARFHRKTKKCQCFSSVKLTFGDGPTLLWEKGDGINRYTVWKGGEPQVYDRVGKEAELPAFVGEHFSPVKMGSKHNLLQVSDQFDPLFLLDLPGTVVADTLSDLGQLDAVNKALALVAKDRRTAVATKKIRVSDLSEIRVQLERYAHLDEETRRAEKLRVDHQAMGRVRARAQLAERLLTETTQAAEEILRVSTYLRNELPAAPVLSTASTRHSTVVAFDLGWSSRATAVRGLTRALGPKLPEASGLQEAARRWGDAGRFNRDLAHRFTLVERLGGLDSLELPEPAMLRRTFDVWQGIEIWLGRLQTIKALFDKSQKVRATADVAFESARATKMLNHMRQLEGFADRLRQLESQATEAAEQLATAERDESSTLAEFSSLGLCPACSQPLAPAHLGRTSRGTQISVSD